MKLPITLETVYKVLRTHFPRDAHVIITCIAEVIKIPDDGKPSDLNTLAIDYQGNLYISEKFWNENIHTEDDLAVFLLHELFHQLTNDTHFIKRLNPKDEDLKLKKLAANIAMDARINAYITRFSSIKDADKTFKSLYTKEMVQENPLHGLLCPGYEDLVPTEMMKSIYSHLYGREDCDVFGFYDLYREVLKYLKDNAIHVDVFLVGDHGDGKGDQETECESGAQEIPMEVKEALIDYLKENGKNFGKKAGNSDALREQFIDSAIGIDQAISLDYFKKLAFDSIMNNVRLVMQATSTERTKDLFIPNKISRSDIFKMMTGHIPISWDVFAVKPVRSKMKIPIYLDVSGSMHSYLPILIQLILNIRDDIEYVWGFSNKVVKHTMEDLRKKRIQTTGGTDFDCIIRHAEENNFNSILVITDGEAYTSLATMGVRLPFLKDVVTVLCTNHRCTDNYFCKTYSNVIQIEEITC